MSVTPTRAYPLQLCDIVVGTKCLLKLHNARLYIGVVRIIIIF